MSSSPWNLAQTLVSAENRGFLLRAVRFLAEQGIRQFVDIGTGFPGPVNVHDIAQAVDPTARILYVDNDPIVVTQARALAPRRAVRQQPIEADHSQLRRRLRPMRGLRTDRTAQVIAAGHAFVQNLCRGHYELGVDAPSALRVATVFTELARAT